MRSGSRSRAGTSRFYNETLGRAILPTPVIGVVGLLEDAERRTTQWFKEEGDVVVLLGDREDGSEAASTSTPFTGGWPACPLRSTSTGSGPCRPRVWRRSRRGCVRSAHDAAEGGLAVALAEGCVTGPRRLGAAMRLPDGGPAWTRLLFGEAPSRILVTTAPAEVARG